MRWVAAGAVLAGLLFAVPAPALAWDEAGYWAFADKLSRRLDESWNERLGRYRPGSPSVDVMTNANMLLVHAAAAARGHEGAARQDARARSIVAQLMGTPPWIEAFTVPPEGHPHLPGWVASMSNPATAQHLVVDGEVTDALAMAWRARGALGIDPAVQALMQDRLRRVADGPYWRYPTLRLNQINWYAEVYAAASEATGDPIWLQRDLRGQLQQFIASIRSPSPGTAGSLGPGMQFHYLPAGSLGSKLNVDSAEYANIVASVVRFYDAAIARGMRPLAAEDEALLRQWMRRVLAGYWTHAGYLNWDTGFSFGRWHQMKKLALAQQALIGIAAGGRLTPSAKDAAWAKHMLERGFELYERKLPEGGGVAPGLFYELKVKPQSNKQAIFAASRMAANVGRAVMAGVPLRDGAEPPPLYAFDPAVGRLAVTTPAYNTAITAVTNGAYPYGGIDLARLYDDRQEVAATLGAKMPASFGIVARNRHGAARLVTARPASRRGPARPLQLLRAPEGVGSAGSPLRAFAGPFDILRVTGVRRAGGVEARSTYTFRRGSILGAWSVRANTSRRRSAEALFPSTGGSRAAVWALLGNGSAVPLSAGRPVQGVAAFWVQSERSGYVVKPRDRVDGATASTVMPGRQPSAPDPGPTLVDPADRAVDEAAGAVLGSLGSGAGPGRGAARGRAVAPANVNCGIEGVGSAAARRAWRLCPDIGVKAPRIGGAAVATVRGAFASIAGQRRRRWAVVAPRFRPHYRPERATDDRRGRRSRFLTQPQLTFVSAAARPRAARRPRPAAPTRRPPRRPQPAARTDRRRRSDAKALPPGRAHTNPSGRAARTPPKTWRRGPRGTAARAGRGPRGRQPGRPGTGTRARRAPGRRRRPSGPPPRPSAARSPRGPRR